MVGEERISKIQHSLCRLVLDLAESSEDLMLVPQVKEKMRSSGKTRISHDRFSQPAIHEPTVSPGIHRSNLVLVVPMDSRKTALKRRQPLHEDSKHTAAVCRAVLSPRFPPDKEYGRGNRW